MRSFLLLILSMACTNSSYSQLVAYASEHINNGKISNYDSAIYMHAKPKLHHLYPRETLINSDSQVCLYKSYSLEKGKLGLSKFQFYNYNKKGEILDKTYYNIKDGLITGCIQNSYSISDSCLEIRGKHLMADGSPTQHKVSDQKVFISAGSIIRKTYNQTTTKLNTIDSSVFDVSNRLIYHSYGTVKDTGFDFHQRDRYIYQNDHLIYKYTKDDYNIRIEEYQYDSSDRLLFNSFHTTTFKTGKTTGQKRIKKYIISNNMIIMYDQIYRTTDGVNYTADLWQYIDSVIYNSGQKVRKYWIYRNNIDGHDSLHQEDHYYYTNDLLTKFITFNQTATGWDSTYMVLTTYSACGKVAQELRYNNLGNNLTHTYSIEITYNTNCDQTLYISKSLTSFHRYSYYYAPYRVGDPDMEYRYHLTVYPVPTSGLLNFEADAQIDHVKVSIFNVSGQLVYQNTSNILDKIFSFDISKLPAGIYQYRFENQYKPVFGKLIKQ